MEREKLTEEERQRLALAGSGSGFDYIPSEEIAKALRIIDAQEEDRAALVYSAPSCTGGSPWPLGEERCVMEREKLTEEERRELSPMYGARSAKALRIIDAQAARVTELEGWYTRAMRDIVDLNKSRGATERENARLNEALAAAESQRDKRSEEAENEFDRAEAAERDRDAANRLLVRVTKQVPQAKRLCAAIETHLSSQPAAPARTEGNYSLAELRRIIRAEPGSLTGAELVVRDAMLEMCAPRTEVETVDCESCAIRGIECDNGDHCDSCGNRMDGCVAATADVCHDCWQTAKSRTAAEAELTALRERVERVLFLWSEFSSQEMYGELFLDGMEAPDHENWTDALEALRGR